MVGKSKKQLRAAELNVTHLVREDNPWISAVLLFPVKVPDSGVPCDPVSNAGKKSHFSVLASNRYVTDDDDQDVTMEYFIK